MVLAATMIQRLRIARNPRNERAMMPRPQYTARKPREQTASRSPPQTARKPRLATLPRLAARFAHSVRSSAYVVGVRVASRPFQSHPRKLIHQPIWVGLKADGGFLAVHSGCLAVIVSRGFLAVCKASPGFGFADLSPNPPRRKYPPSYQCIAIYFHLVYTRPWDAIHETLETRR